MRSPRENRHARGSLGRNRDCRGRAAVVVAAMFNFAIADDYDYKPAPDTSFNYLTTSVGLSLGL